MDAIGSFVVTVRDLRGRGLHVLAVAPDLRNAFNIAWRPSVVDAKGRLGLPDNLVRMCGSFLCDRAVCIGSFTCGIDRGCRRGRVLDRRCGSPSWKNGLRG